MASAPAPDRTPRAAALAAVSFLTAPLGFLLLLFLRWPWTWKLSLMGLWALFVGYQRYDWAKALLGLSLAVYAVAMLASRDSWARLLGGFSAVFFAATVVGAWAPPISTLSVRQPGPGPAPASCVSAYADERTPFMSLPLHGGACYDGVAATYSWEDCGGSTFFTLVTQTCGHRRLPDGSLRLTTDYRVSPWIAPWLVRAGSNSFTIRPDGSVVR